MGMEVFIFVGIKGWLKHKWATITLCVCVCGEFCGSLFLGYYYVAVYRK